MDKMREAFERWVSELTEYDCWQAWQAAQAEAQQKYNNEHLIKELYDCKEREAGLEAEKANGAFHPWKAALEGTILKQDAEIAGLQELLKEKDEALELIIYNAFCLPKDKTDLRPYHRIAEEALSHTSTTDALDRYRNEVLAELRRMAKGE